MKPAPFIFCCLMLAGCTVSPSDPEAQQQDTVASVADTNTPVARTNALHENEPSPAHLAFIDSLSKRVFDTTTQEGCRAAVMNRFLIENGGRSPEYDTLLDLNYDGVDDYAIGWYGMAGTGLKHGWDVFLWNKRQRNYEQDTILSWIPNPSFFRKERMVTSFYLPHGTGRGEKKEWRDGVWRTTMEFMVENDEEKSVWAITDTRTGHIDSIKHPYEFVPLQKILPHHYTNE